MRVLLAIDGSPHSQAAVIEAVGMPWPKETEVEIFCYSGPLPVPLWLTHPAPSMLFDRKVQPTTRPRQST